MLWRNRTLSCGRTLKAESKTQTMETPSVKETKGIMTHTNFTAAHKRLDVLLSVNPKLFVTKSRMELTPSPALMAVARMKSCCDVNALQATK